MHIMVCYCYMNNKVCTKCKLEKPIDEFFKSGKYPSGKNKIRGDCKACASLNTSQWRAKNRAHYNSYMGEWRGKNPDKVRIMEIKRNYGLSIEDYHQMVREQNNQCKICGKSPNGIRPLAIDHCHITGRIRGLLCYNCNRAIVILDDKDHLEKALNYLKI